MAVKLALGEIPEKVKENVEKYWKSGKIKELMKEIHKDLKKMNREKLENLVGRKVDVLTPGGVRRIRVPEVKKEHTREYCICHIKERSIYKI